MGLECAVAKDGGDCVRVIGVQGMRGEAYVERDAKGKVTRAYDLRFDVAWAATVGGRAFDGVLRFTEVSSQNEPDEFEVEARFGEDGLAPDGVMEQPVLVGLLGAVADGQGARGGAAHGGGLEGGARLEGGVCGGGFRTGGAATTAAAALSHTR